MAENIRERLIVRDLPGGGREVTNPLAIDISPTMTLPSLLMQRAALHPNDTVIERNALLGDTWNRITARQFATQVRRLASGLLAHGWEKGQRIGILATTSFEWTLLDYACQSAGIVTVPIYESDSAEQIRWVIEDANICAIFCDDRTHQTLIQAVDADIPTYTFVDGPLEILMQRGEVAGEDTVEHSIHDLTHSDVATIVYTSGTTGRPRGAILTHGNLVTGTLAGCSFFPDAVRVANVRTLVFLPLAHIYARIVVYMTLAGDGVCGHVPNTRNLLADLASFRPTTIGAVPRVLEKLYSAADAKAGSGIMKRIFRLAAHTAMETGRLIEERVEPHFGQRLKQRAADKLVLRKIKNLMGGQIRNVVSGGAPLSADIQRFFTGAGLYVYQGYGLTEAEGGIACNIPEYYRSGTVGIPLPGATIRVDDSGEVLLRGGTIFAGYLNNPEQTAQALDEEGWFHTGDLGSIDEEGFLTITGRKKELIVTAGGKNVQPAVLEDALRTHPLISQIVVIGDRQRFISALVTLDAEMLPSWLNNHKLPNMDVLAAANHPAVRSSIQLAIAKANRQVSRAESIRKFSILTTDFTEDNGLLTPSLKVKRAEVVKRFANEIAKIYA
ncbi:MAG: long-chain fatty acid--CoA ligase [Varibaculum sp.]|nr:long-chain fatty acid--CoA ligase [Varibaculum sp.]